MANRILNISACIVVALVAGLLVTVILGNRVGMPEPAASSQSPVTTTYRPTIPPTTSPPPQPPPPRKEPRLFKAATLSASQSWTEIEAVLESLPPTDQHTSADLVNCYDRLSSPAFTNSENLADHLEKLTAWQAECPDSTYPLVVMAGATIQHAWDARGDGFAGTVTEEGWRLFHERLVDARLLLEEAEAKGVKDAMLYCHLITLAMGEGVDRDQTMGWFKAGVQIDPHCQRLYESMARYLLPRWHGEEGDIDRFAKEVLELAPGEPGLIAFANLAYFKRFNEPVSLFWGDYDRSTLVKSAEALVQENPEPQALNFAAYAAWIAQDREAAKRFRGLMGDDVVERIWGNRQRYDVFSRWCDARAEVTADHSAWGAMLGVRWLAFASNDGFIWCNSNDPLYPIHLVDMHTGRLRSRLAGPRLSMYQFSFEPKHGLVVAAVADEQQESFVAVWKTDASDLPLAVPVEGPCRAAAISPQELLLAYQDGPVVKLHDLGGGEAKQSLSLPDENLIRILFSPDGKLLATWSKTELAVWDVTSGAKQYGLNAQATPETPDAAADPLAFDAEGRLISIAKTLARQASVVRRAKDGTVEATLLDGIDKNSRVAISPDRRQLLVEQFPTPTIEVWDVATKSLTRRIPAQEGGLAMAFSADGKSIVSGGRDGTLKVWKLADAEPTGAK
jgi:hypothetical protein